METRIPSLGFLERLTFDPVQFFKNHDWEIDGKENDNRSLALERISPLDMLFESCLSAGESSISGEEKLKRLKKGGNIRLDAGFFLALWEEEGHKTLNWFYGNRHITYLDFPGTVLVNQVSCRFVLCLFRTGDGLWHWYFSWLDHEWDETRLSVSIANR